MFMDSNHATAGNSWTAPTVQNESSQGDESVLEKELENRIKNLDKLVHSVDDALHQVSFSGKPRALDLMNDLHVKIQATHNLLRVAKLLSDPARESMLSRVRDSLDDLEQAVASNFDVEMT
jgi:hypothetical protein